MRTDELRLPATDGKQIFVYRWAPEDDDPARGSVQIAHGMAEHAGRYARVAERLTAAGYVVWANDLRGHGRTAASPAELGSLGDHDGWTLTLHDLATLDEHVRTELPGVPRCLLGHSMGSFLAQADMARRPGAYHAVVLSGSNAGGGALVTAGRLIARLERVRLGRRGHSPLLRGMTFDSWNKAFRPNRTGFDWLSRDEAEVDAYVRDPLCGIPIATQMWIDLLDALSRLGRSETYAHIPRDLPILVIAGTRDPVGDFTRGLERLLRAYGRVGLTRVAHRFYPGARHELFHETNRDEVLTDLVEWLDTSLASPGGTPGCIFGA